MSLLGDLYAFYLEHRPCCDLESGVSETAAGACRVWMTCSGVARIDRVVTQEVGSR
jgi:hypothetical protein